MQLLFQRTLHCPGVLGTLIADTPGMGYYPNVMIFSKKHAGKWVASKGKKVLAVDPHLSGVLKKVKGQNQDSLQLAFVPKTPFLIGHAV